MSTATAGTATMAAATSSTAMTTRTQP
jgi:hypothetical protein